ncbi:MAG: hypothetical protein M0Z70_07230 [Nitrospiraceae bacterium]|jgi:hypothetical protein|nr:hypothetical protein [Nitrospiraceae bacterium]
MKAEHRRQMTEDRQRRIIEFLVCILCSVFCVLLVLPYHAGGADKNQQFQFTKNQQIQQIKPKKPVKIKLHRNAKGEYSWELTGDNVDEVFNADKRLRKSLKLE